MYNIVCVFLSFFLCSSCKITEKVYNKNTQAKILKIPPGFFNNSFQMQK